MNPHMPPPYGYVHQQKPYASPPPMRISISRMPHTPLMLINISRMPRSQCRSTLPHSVALWALRRQRVLQPQEDPKVAGSGRFS